MSRPVKEWIGATDSTPVPQRVKLRVFDRQRGICQCGCTRKIEAGERWDTDHVIALINGGENRERNLQVLLEQHHKEKTKRDMAQKSATYDKRCANLGIKASRQKIRSRGFMKAPPQRSATRPIERRGQQ